MKTKKESRKRDSSSSSSSSSSASSGSDSDSKQSSDSSNKPEQPKAKPRDVKSKWDSPVPADDQVDKLRKRSQELSRANRLRERSEEREGSSRQRRPVSPPHSPAAPAANHRDRGRNHREPQSDSREHRNRSRRDYDHKEDRNRPRGDHRDRSRSPPYRPRSVDRRRRGRGLGRRSRSNSFDHSKATWGKSEHNQKTNTAKEKEKEKPNFGLSGKLTEETNTYRGFVIKYSEPPEARKPKRRWRLYPFKGEKAMQTLYIHRESAYLIGRERKIVDLPVDHPSCSKQHAALQYRLVPFTRDDGSAGKRVRPYLIDLESANGTFINNKKIDAKKYIELLERDVIKFGFSSREYVLLHENSKDEAQDDDVNEQEEVLVVVKTEA